MDDSERWLPDKHEVPRDNHAHELTRYCHCRPSLEKRTMRPGPFDIAGTTVSIMIVVHSRMMNGNRGW